LPSLKLLRKQARAWLACWSHTASGRAGAWQSDEVFARAKPVVISLAKFQMPKSKGQTGIVLAFKHLDFNCHLGFDIWVCSVFAFWFVILIFDL
jgi:hypothetical protein